MATEERLRNHTLYTSYQHNRNPFVDHPEYVWAIWGPTPNDSRLFLGAIEPGDGDSTVVVDLGEVIKDGPVPGPQDVTFNKSGLNPTTYDIALTGEATSPQTGLRQSFSGGGQSRALSVGLSTSTATAGLKAGTLGIDNTDLTSSGAGHGSDDGDDVAEVALRVLDHADGSFAFATDQNTLLIDFGAVEVGTGMHQVNFTIYNLETTSGFAAGLDLDSVVGAGDTAALTTDLAPFINLAANSSQAFTVALDASAIGDYSATYTISLTDEDLPGAQSMTDLTLTLIGQVAASACAAADANCDSVISFEDAEPFVDVLLGVVSPCSTCAANTNGDAELDAADIQPFIDAILGF